MKNQRKRISWKKPELFLDDITNSDDPEVNLQEPPFAPDAENP